MAGSGQRGEDQGDHDDVEDADGDGHGELAAMNSPSIKQERRQTGAVR
jgi:hypothetical protein